MSEPLTDPHAQGPAEEREIGDVPWSVGHALMVLILWMFVALFGIGYIIFRIQRGSPEDAVQLQAIGLPLTHLVFLGITLGYVAWRGWSVRRLFGPRPPSLRAAAQGVGVGLLGVVGVAYGLGLVLQLIAAALETQLPVVQEGFREIAAEPVGLPFLVVSSIAIAPVAEEVFFRGMLFTALRRSLPIWPAMTISAAVFGLNHFEPGLLDTLMIALVVVPLGMLLAWSYERTGTILVPILGHALFNLYQVIALIGAAGQA